MDKYYVLVAGSGSSSRANIEALIEDHIYANGPEVTFVLPFKEKISQGQVFLAQYAKDRGKDIVVFAPPSADLSTAPNSSFSPSEDPLAESIKFISDDKSFVFLLWNDEDMELLRALNLCVDAGINVYDLTDGLNLISMAERVETNEPIIPEAEKVKPTIDLDDLDDLDDVDDVDDEEYEDEEELEDMDEDILAVTYSLVEALTDVVTKKVLEALEAQAEDAPKKPSKGSKK